jgi:hypothetical protein
MPRQKSLTPDILDLAIAGIDAKISELKEQREQLLAGRGDTSQPASATSTSSAATATRGRGAKKGGKMSAAARRMISEKLKARWAERKRAAQKDASAGAESAGAAQKRAGAKGKKAAVTGGKKAAAKARSGEPGETGQ